MFSSSNLLPKLLIIFSLAILVTFFVHKKQLWQTKKLENKVQEASEKADSAKNNIKPKISSELANSQTNTNSKNLSEEEIKNLAKLVTVRIFTEESDSERGGSGVIIGERNGDYLVVTNNHVVSDTNINYHIETYLQNIYPAEIIWQNNQDLTVNDLALLKFKSSEEYQIIKVKNTPYLGENQLVFASGFPFEKNLQQSRQINYTVGRVDKILSKPLKGGYQLGYTNLIHSGMSGGSILNSQGELIGINGLGKYPILGNPYVYQNGDNIPEQEIDKMSELSWGIPGKYINELINHLLTNPEKISAN